VYFTKVIIAFLALTVSGVLLSAPHSTAARQLKNIDSHIASIKSALSEQQQRRDQLLQELERLETTTAKTQKALFDTTDQLNKQSETLTEVKKNQQHYQSQLDQQRLHFAEEIRVGYRLFHQPALKLLLNQDNSATLQRMLMYYQFLSQGNLNSLSQLQATLNQLEQNQQLARQHYTTLLELQQQQKQQRNQLTQLKRERQTLAKSLNQSIASNSQRLQQLMRNRRKLETTLRQLARAKHQFDSSLGPFVESRGRLQWPTDGRVLPLFGTKIQQSELRWGGDIIKAKEGQSVYSVAPGKVVYADWLSGYGLLLIVTHGNGYMTLYGRNRSLYKQVGDTVTAGELISTVGNSGGFDETGLYFAIRHNAEPLDPAAWCR